MMPSKSPQSPPQTECPLFVENPCILNLNGSESTKIKSEKMENENMETKHSNNHMISHPNNLIFGVNQYPHPPPHQFPAFPPNAKWVPLTTHYSSPFAPPPPPTPQFPPNPTTFTPINYHLMIPLIANNANNGNVINEDDIFGNKFIPTMNHQNSPSHSVAHRVGHPNPFMFIPQNSVETNQGKKRKRNESEIDDNDNDNDNDHYNEEEDEEENDENETEDDEDYNPSEDESPKITKNKATRSTKKRKLNKSKTAKTKTSSSKGTERHYCSYCPKSFAQNCHLSRHIREKHSATKPLFECRICDKAFNQRSNLKVHLRSHALDEKVSRPWLCTECYPNRRFTRKSSLKRHWVKKHKTISAQLISDIDRQTNEVKDEPNIKKERKVENSRCSMAQMDIAPNMFSVPCSNLNYDNSLPPPLV